MTFSNVISRDVSNTCNLLNLLAPKIAVLYKKRRVSIFQLKGQDIFSGIPNVQHKISYPYIEKMCVLVRGVNLKDLIFFLTRERFWNGP